MPSTGAEITGTAGARAGAEVGRETRGTADVEPGARAREDESEAERIAGESGVLEGIPEEALPGAGGGISVPAVAGLFWGRRESINMSRRPQEYAP